MAQIENPALDRAWARLTELHRLESRTYDPETRQAQQAAIHSLNQAIAALRAGKPSQAQKGLSGWL